MWCCLLPSGYNFDHPNAFDHSGLLQCLKDLKVSRLIGRGDSTEAGANTQGGPGSYQWALGWVESPSGCELALWGEVQAATYQCNSQQQGAAQEGCHVGYRQHTAECQCKLAEAYLLMLALLNGQGSAVVARSAE